MPSCLTHFKREITRNISQLDAKNFKDQCTQLSISSSFEQALPRFEKLILDYNLSENFHRRLEWLRQRMSGFFRHRLKFKDVDEELKLELKKAEQQMALAAKGYKNIRVDIHSSNDSGT